MAPARIGVAGEFQPSFEPHTAIGTAVEHAVAADPSCPPIALEWVETSDAEHVSEERVAAYAGWWIALGSPYRSMNGALRIIRYAREHDVPLLGTCGGYQHVVLEYARNVLGFADAAHAEYDPYASDLFITALSCSLAGRTMNVAIRTGTTAARLYRSSTTTEQCYCNFGLNLDHLPALTAAGLVVFRHGPGWRTPHPRAAESSLLPRHFVRTSDVEYTRGPTPPSNRLSSRRGDESPLALSLVRLSSVHVHAGITLRGNEIDSVPSMNGPSLNRITSLAPG